MSNLIEKRNNENTNYYLLSFAVGIILSLLFFLPLIIYDKGYFLYYGDFNVQQIPFYQMIHDSIKNGEFFWNFKTDLGVNLIGSYTFYLLTSPFFWLTLIFPSNAVPYLMGPLLILKFGCLSLSSYIYLKRYVKNPKIAILGAALYAFSGFSIYNVFFNHFHEAMIVFSLLLAAIDKFMYEGTRHIVCLAVFTSCFINYYFFVGQVIFVVLYWTFKTFYGDFKVNINKIAILIFESVLGVLLSSVMLLPSIMAIIQNPRINSIPVGWEALLYGKEQRYIHIIECLFFPPDIPARPNFTPDSDAKWASLGAWLPMISMSGVIAWLQIKREHWLKKFLVALFVFALVPVLNSVFQLFNSAYYARWFYMLTLMMCLATVMSLQYSKVDWQNAIKWTTIITIAIAFPIGFTRKSNANNISFIKSFGLMNYPDRFWIYVSFSLIGILATAIIMSVYKHNKTKMIKNLSMFLFSTIFLYSTYVLSLGKAQSYDTHNFIIPHCLNGKEEFNISDIESCRVDVYNGMDNQAMFWQFPTIQAFHSIVPGSVMEYYPSVGVKRDVGSRPETKFFGIRALTSCKWLFDYSGNDKSFGGPFKDNPKMPGWEYYGNQNNFDIWENKYFVPYGFSYDNYVSLENFNNTLEANRNLLMMKAIVLDNNQIQKYADILQELKNTSAIDYSNEAYFSDCIEKKNNSCSYFSYDKFGFSAKFENTSDKDKLIFFSVPYESGWKAYVNDTPVQIDKVNIGFMAIRVPANQTSNIRFNYFTPGLKFGAITSGIALIIFATYVFINKKWLKNSFVLDHKRYIFASVSDLNTAENFKRRKNKI